MQFSILIGQITISLTCRALLAKSDLHYAQYPSGKVIIRRIKMILSYVQTHGRVTRREVMALCGAMSARPPICCGNSPTGER